MNPSPTCHSTPRCCSILLLTVLIAAFMHGSAQAMPVWLLVVPFVLLAAEELGAESRGRREYGESNPARAGASGSARALGSQRLIPVSTLAFHGVVIASVIGAHWEMGRGNLNSPVASNSRYVMSKNPTSGGCGTGGMCGGTAGGASGGCGSGGCGSGGSGGCGGGCGGGASVAGSAAKASAPMATNVPPTRPTGVPPRQFATSPAGATPVMAPASVAHQQVSPAGMGTLVQGTPSQTPPAIASLSATQPPPNGALPNLAAAIQRATELKAAQAAARKSMPSTGHDLPKPGTISPTTKSLIQPATAPATEGVPRQNGGQTTETIAPNGPFAGTAKLATEGITAPASAPGAPGPVPAGASPPTPGK